MTDLPPEYLEVVGGTLRNHGVRIAPGLTESELSAAEAAHGFRFPPDLRSLLAHALPEAEQFPDWRHPDSAFIADRLAWPADSMCFDVEHDGFWLPAWGPRPETLEAAWTRAREAVRAAPFLIPLHAHRYLPAVPCIAGNPVFSVYQTDIIYYGFDLPSYLAAEFGVPNPLPAPEEPREIEFWSELEQLNGPVPATDHRSPHGRRDLRHPRPAPAGGGGGAPRLRPDRPRRRCRQSRDPSRAFAL